MIYLVFFKAPTQVCTQTQEVTTCRDFLGKFIRSPGQNFADCLTIFKAVYGHWQQLLRPVNRLELKDLSILTLKLNKLLHFQCRINAQNYSPLGPNSSFTIRSQSPRRTYFIFGEETKSLVKIWSILYIDMFSYRILMADRVLGMTLPMTDSLYAADRCSAAPDTKQAKNSRKLKYSFSIVLPNILKWVLPNLVQIILD